ncbi:MAG: hypothetical protein JW716_02085 [Candidatus Aenigmarchaeota archaeon]|nr:hypothetical protein [Candidatus Aenigmarchaeota archaeon]
MGKYLTDVTKIQNPAAVYRAMQEAGIGNFGEFHISRGGKRQEFLATRENATTGRYEEGILTYNNDGNSSFEASDSAKLAKTSTKRRVHEGAKRAWYESIPWPVKAKTNYNGVVEKGRASKKFWGTVLRYGGPILMYQQAIREAAASGEPIGLTKLAVYTAAPFAIPWAINFIKGAVKAGKPNYSASRDGKKGFKEDLKSRVGSSVAVSTDGRAQQIANTGTGAVQPEAVIKAASTAAPSGPLDGNSARPSAERYETILKTKKTRIRNLTGERDKARMEAEEYKTKYMTLLEETRRKS